MLNNVIGGVPHYLLEAVVLLYFVLTGASIYSDVPMYHSVTREPRRNETAQVHPQHRLLQAGDISNGARPRRQARNGVEGGQPNPFTTCVSRSVETAQPGSLFFVSSCTDAVARQALVITRCPRVGYTVHALMMRRVVSRSVLERQLAQR